ncbi:MAG: tRNA uridine-5-carboxymethylaminomethyl(34) synthesis enzyme MnmG [Clostridia bacterium]|nr:tRNA uridine-5-carboxymethylaminomethyl(34) synthesis enzyme MnmG [Clostridia bacterium]
MNNGSHDTCYDIIVVGAGHAGCEAALAAARLGFSTLLLTLNLDALALMPCNPAIGGTAKGHLVREVDALGGEMGLAIDDAFIQSRMLNTGKGPAVRSLRAQADKKAYQARMLRALITQPGLTLRQAEVAELRVEHGRITGLVTTTGARLACRAAVLCAGVYMDSRIIIGEAAWPGGPQGLQSTTGLAVALRGLGIHLQRFKTGTPARIDGSSIDFAQMEPQPGDEPVTPFSFLTDRPLANRALCYLPYTNEATHQIIRENFHRAPMYTGKIDGVGARYCPSIEDKVTRFADKERHPVFVEPEGLDSPEWYVQGMSTSMPEDVQIAMYRTLPGLSRAVLLRLAYAIEYECVDPLQLTATLRHKDIGGLYFAGQINGTSGYEEAAAQGLLAGVNAALELQEKPSLVLGRDQAYIGVLVDDLVTKGTQEPYRMMTSRAEYRLLLRQDNADLRLTELGYRIGLVTKERYERLQTKRHGVTQALERLNGLRFPPGPALDAWLQAHGQPPAQAALTATELLRRPGLRYSHLADLDGDWSPLPPQVEEQVDITIRYQGYIDKQNAQVVQFRRAEGKRLPPGVDYAAIPGLRIEARQKLAAQRPDSIGMASRISGVSPSDVAVLLVWLEKQAKEQDKT